MAKKKSKTLPKITNLAGESQKRTQQRKMPAGAFKGSGQGSK